MFLLCNFVRMLEFYFFRPTTSIFKSVSMYVFMCVSKFVHGFFRKYSTDLSTAFGLEFLISDYIYLYLIYIG